jgi:hypothetical protein
MPDKSTLALAAAAAFAVVTLAPGAASAFVAARSIAARPQIAVVGGINSPQSHYGGHYYNRYPLDVGGGGGDGLPANPRQPKSK